MLKTLGPIKTLGRLKKHRGPMTIDEAYLELLRLSKEKHRLEKEVQFWERKSGQIRRRMEEIGQQMMPLKQSVHLNEESSDGKQAAPSSLKRCKEMTLKYG